MNNTITGYVKQLTRKKLEKIAINMLLSNRHAGGTMCSFCGYCGSEEREEHELDCVYRDIFDEEYFTV